MSGIEVRKGSSQIKYGPNTTGGAINFFSTYLPEDFVVKADLFAGNFGYHNIHAYAGKTFQNGGILAESFLLNSSGFKDLDNGGDTGFSKEDYMVKGRINTNSGAKVYQALNFKIGMTQENSNETYLGLTQKDFDSTPFRRYAGSQLDNMDSKHTQWHFRHLIQPFKFMDITTTVYRNEFKRNWYKLDKVRGSAGGSPVGISNILEDPETFGQELAIIRGTTSDFEDALSVKANNRSYEAHGIESIFGFNFNSTRLDHELELGVRYHQDQMDRYQWVDGYRMLKGTMQMTSKGIPGTDSNQILEADALSSFVQYKLSWDRLMITTGIRYENIQLTDSNFGKNDPTRTGNELNITKNQVDVWIPGIGLDYDFSSNLSGFAGYHKGFTPPGATEGTLPETSHNYEAGIRYNNHYWHINSTIYYNDYDNLLGADLAATGGSGSIDQFNGGESTIYGLEHEMTYDLAGLFRSRVSLPLTVQYTYTNATFNGDFESEYEPWGTVNQGDHLPYLPEHQFVINFGAYYKRIAVNLSSNFVGPMRARAGQGDIREDELIPQHFVCDLSVNYQIANFLDLYGSMFNIFNEVYEVARRPAGLRPGMPQQFRFGLKAYID
jgi:Fe(3+) dicitrate transport protein